MAFNLLVELPVDFTEWEELNSVTNQYTQCGIECFPISNENNFLGIAFIGRAVNNERVNALKGLLTYLLEKEYPVFELYSSSQFLPHNIDILLRKFFE